jgi:hypothetical protein
MTVLVSGIVLVGIFGIVAASCAALVIALCRAGARPADGSDSKHSG